MLLSKPNNDATLMGILKRFRLQDWELLIFACEQRMHVFVIFFFSSVNNILIEAVDMLVCGKEVNDIVSGISKQGTRFGSPHFPFPKLHVSL